MMTLTGRDARTLTGYVYNLLDYPRWLIERDVDFSNCHYHGSFTESAERCTTCRFGVACRWLGKSSAELTPNDPLPELMDALATAARYLKQTYCADHERGCDCETCAWLVEVRNFLRSQRH